jgi:hypothetical protein
MDKENNEVNESGYNSGAKNASDISFFSTIQQQEEEHYKWLASLTPEQHLQNAVANIKRIYAKELSEQTTPSKELRFEGKINKNKS